MKFSSSTMLFAISTSAILLQMATQFTMGAYVTPSTGKYFFGQLDSKGYRSYVKFGLGSNGQFMNLMLNSEELTLALFTD